MDALFWFLFWFIMIVYILPLVIMGVFMAVITPLYWLLKGLRQIGLKDEVQDE